MASRSGAIRAELMRCERELRSLGMRNENMLGTQLSVKLETPKKAIITLRGHKITVEEQTAGSVTEDQFKQIFEFKAFVDWCENLDNAFFDPMRYEFSCIWIQSLDMFGPRIGFLKIKTDMKYLNKKNQFTPLPSIVFLRGAAVAVLMIVWTPEEPDKKYAVITVQPRAAAGSPAFCEIPAGMMDESGDFIGVAAKEIKEETGLTIHPSGLIDLMEYTNLPHSNGLYPSVGGCDERIKFFLYESEMSAEKIERLNGTVAGNAAEGEEIRVQVVETWLLPHRCPDMKTFTALYLYDRYHHYHPETRRGTLTSSSLRTKK